MADDYVGNSIEEDNLLDLNEELSIELELELCQKKANQRNDISADQAAERPNPLQFADRPQGNNAAERPQRNALEFINAYSSRMNNQVARELSSLSLQNNPSVRRMERFRGIGRTTKMAEVIAEKMCRDIECARLIVVVFHTTRELDIFSRAIWDSAANRIAARLGVPVPECPRLVTIHDPNFCFGPPPSYRMVHPSDLFVDHHAVEEEFSSILEMAHAFDPFVGVSNPCIHPDVLTTPTANLLWCSQCGALILNGQTLSPRTRTAAPAPATEGVEPPPPEIENPYMAISADGTLVPPGSTVRREGGGRIVRVNRPSSLPIGLTSRSPNESP